MFKRIYHAIRRWLYPHLYWTKEEIDRAEKSAKEFMELFPLEDVPAPKHPGQE